MKPSARPLWIVLVVLSGCGDTRAKTQAAYDQCMVTVEKSAATAKADNLTEDRQTAARQNNTGECELLKRVCTKDYYSVDCQAELASHGK